MRTFAEKPKALQQAKTAESTKPSRPLSGQSLDVQSMRTLGNQAVLRLLQSNGEEREDRSLLADQVTCMPEPCLQRQVEPQKEEEEEEIQLKPLPSTGSVQQQSKEEEDLQMKAGRPR